MMFQSTKIRIRNSMWEKNKQTKGATALEEKLLCRCESLHLDVSQGEGDVVELVDVGGFDGGRHHLGVDSDFPRPGVARVVGDARVAAGLQDVSQAVIPRKHH